MSSSHSTTLFTPYLHYYTDRLTLIVSYLYSAYSTSRSLGYYATLNVSLMYSAIGSLQLVLSPLTRRTQATGPLSEISGLPSTSCNSPAPWWILSGHQCNRSEFPPKSWPVHSFPREKLTGEKTDRYIRTHLYAWKRRERQAAKRNCVRGQWITGRKQFNHYIRCEVGKWHTHYGNTYWT